MPNKNLAIAPGEVVNADFAFYDGEQLVITVARNGVVGNLYMTIASRPAGEAIGTEAERQVSVTVDDKFVLDADSLGVVQETVRHYHTVWAVRSGTEDEGADENGLVHDVVAIGRVDKLAAIRLVSAGGPSPVAPSFSADPVITGTLEVGENLTVSNGTVTGTSPITYSYAWSRNGVTTQTYTLTGADDGLAAPTCDVTATNAAGSAVATAPSIGTVTYPAPTVTGSLADVTITQNAGNATRNAATAISGATGGAWFVNVDGSPDASVATVGGSGVVTILDDTVYASSTIEVGYTNSGGTASVSFTATVEAPVVVDGSATLTEYTTTDPVFDSKAAFNLSSATLPFVGTTDAADGSVIEARTVYDSDFAQHTPWAEIATAIAGNYSGDLIQVTRPSGGRAGEWLRREVRVKNSAAAATRSTGRCVAGHGIDIWGQSEIHRAVLSAFPGPSDTPAVIDAECLQVSYSDATGSSYGTSLTRHFVGAGMDANLDKKLIPLANLLATERPDEKFHIVFHTCSGTSARGLLLDSVTSDRTWADDLAIHNFARPDGDDAGLAVTDWYAADSGPLGINYGTFWLRAISGLDTDGTPDTNLDQYFNVNAPTPGFYEDAKTKWAFIGPHRFESNSFDTSIPNNRISLDAAFENPILSTRAEREIEPLCYLNGATDSSHPAASNLDGIARYLQLIGYGCLQALRFGQDTPILDRWTYNELGQFLLIGSTAGQVTTTRQARGEMGTLPSGRPEVYAVQINGVPTDNATLVDGEILVTGVVAGDAVVVGGESIGTETLPDDISVNEVWKDWPIVDRGQAGLEGLPVRGRAVVPAGVIPDATAPSGYNPTVGTNIAPDGSSFREGIINTFASGGWSNETASPGTFWPDATNSDETITIDCTDNGTFRGVLGDTVWTSSPMGVAITMKFYVSGDGLGTLNVWGSAEGGGTGITFASQTVDLSTDKSTLITLTGTPDPSRSRIEFKGQMSIGGSGTLTLHTPVVEIV